MRVAVIGLGKLGMPCAEVFATEHSVTGYDVEPRTSDVIDVKPTIAEAVDSAELIFVAVPTPHDPLYGGAEPIAELSPKDFDYGYVIESFRALNAVVRPEQVVVLISTVLPGTVRRQLIPELTNARFIYNPYLIAMGSVKWDLVNPEIMIVGTRDGGPSDELSLLKGFYGSFTKADKYAVGTWDEAECIKIFYNTFISMKLSFVNMIQDVAERNGNIDVDVVCDALKMSDMRIVSERYMTAGMGDGGPCHPRDNIALRHLADRLDLGYDLFSSIMISRERQAENMAKRLVELAEEHDLPIVIHGKAYKPKVGFLDGSYSLLVGHYIEERGHAIHWLDPETGDTTPVVGPAVHLLAHNPDVAYTHASGMATGSGTYSQFSAGSIVLDPWRKVSPTDDVRILHYGNSRPGG